MINFLKITFFTFTIWLLAACLNTALYMAFFEPEELANGNWEGSCILSLFFTLVFSLPAIFCFWLIFLANTTKPDLSYILLRWALILSAGSCVFMVFLPADVYNSNRWLLALFIIISSVLSVLLHHRFIKSFHTKISTDV